MTIPGLAAVLDGADTVIRVTPKELHRAFVRGDTGIIGEASFVSADMNDHGDGDEAAIDGDVNFSRLAEWLNSRFRHTIARSEMVNSPFDPAGQDTPRWFAWPIAPFRFFWRQ